LTNTKEKRLSHFGSVEKSLPTLIILVLVAIEHFGGLSSAFGGLFGE